MSEESWVLDVGERDFEQEVLLASRSVPVVVDFWAEWCGPCKTLGPMLERLAREAAGGFRLCKVDTEKEPRLAALFQVQSIPFVVGFEAGRPVDAFMGAQPEPEVRAFLDRLGVVFGATEPEPDPAAEPGPLDGAAAILRRADPVASQTFWDRLDAIEEDEDEAADAARLLEARPFFDSEPVGEGPAAEALRQGRRAWLAGDADAAMESLLGSVGEDPGLADALARRALVALMQLEAHRIDRVAAVRRRLAALLY